MCHGSALVPGPLGGFLKGCLGAAGRGSTESGSRSAGSAFPSRARARLRGLCWYLLSGSQLKAVLSREHSLLLAKEELSERCLPPCAVIPAILGQKLWCAMIDLQVWHHQLVSVTTMLGITWLLHQKMFRQVFDQNRCKIGKKQEK